HVVLGMECLRTRVQFPPPPPYTAGILRDSGFFLVLLPSAGNPERNWDAAASDGHRALSAGNRSPLGQGRCAVLPGAVAGSPRLSDLRHPAGDVSAQEWLPLCSFPACGTTCPPEWKVGTRLRAAGGGEVTRRPVCPHPNPPPHAGEGQICPVATNASPPMGEEPFFILLACAGTATRGLPQRGRRDQK